MPMSFNALRVGKKYRLVNYGETSEFTVEKIKDEQIEVKDIHTTENYTLHDLIKFGKGKDYDLLEL